MTLKKDTCKACLVTAYTDMKPDVLEQFLEEFEDCWGLEERQYVHCPGKIVGDFNLATKRKIWAAFEKELTNMMLVLYPDNHIFINAEAPTWCPHKEEHQA
jgi:hypothetical protein